MSITARAVWFVESHLGDDLSAETIAAAVGVSRFHLSRAAAATLGVPLTAYVRGRRLSEAARALQAGAPGILDVALDAGYGSHEAFTRAFRQHFGVTPEQVRRVGLQRPLALTEAFRMTPAQTPKPATPRLVDHGPLLLVGLLERHEGSNAAIPLQWQRFVPHIGHIDHAVPNVTYGVVSPVEDCNAADYVAAVEVRRFGAVPPELTRMTLPARRYAAFVHEGHVSGVSATWRAIWDGALADAGLTPLDAPAFERYGPSFDPHTGLGGVEVWVPVE